MLRSNMGNYRTASRIRKHLRML